MSANTDSRSENEIVPSSPLSWTLMILAVAASIGGILLAAASDDPIGWGGRGGALAVAISFGILFARETSAEKPFRDLIEIRNLAKEIVPTQQVSEPDDAVDAIVALLAQRSAAQSRQNVALAVVGIFATLVWGFGDLVAKPLYPVFHGGRPYRQDASAVNE